MDNLVSKTGLFIQQMMIYAQKLTPVIHCSTEERCMQIHKRFTAKQVKALLKGYCQRCGTSLSAEAIEKFVAVAPQLIGCHRTSKLGHRGTGQNRPLGAGDLDNILLGLLSQGG